MEDILEEDIAPPVRVILSDRVVAKMRDGIPRAGLLEVGGLMMGENVADNVFRVLDISLTVGEPGRYYLDPAEHQSFVDEFRGEFCDEGRFRLIGSWHSHPSGDPEPGKRDLQTLRATMAHPSTDLAFKVLLIACLDANAQLRAGGVVLTREPKVLSKIEVVIEPERAQE